jgi:hypothetical protein
MGAGSIIGLDHGEESDPDAFAGERLHNTAQVI